MPEFKIKNLMVDVVSSVRVPDLDRLCLFPTQCQLIISKCYKWLSPCRWFTCGWPLSCPKYSLVDCPDHSVIPCAGGSVPCAGSDLPIGFDETIVVIDLRRLVVNPGVIKEVQAELDEVLNAVAQRGVEINKEMAPQTKAQAEVLEAELKAALAEVQKLKKTLE